MRLTYLDRTTRELSTSSNPSGESAAVGSGALAESTWRSFSLALKHLRAHYGLTQDELAARSGVSVRSISDLERGISRAPHRDTVRLLSVALGLTDAEAAGLLALARPGNEVDAHDALTDIPFWTVPCIGREDDLATLEATLARPDSRLLTLVGVAGIGKTRLALEIAARMTGAAGERVFFIDLAAISSARYVLPAIAQHLGLREQPATAIMTVIQNGLRDRRTLLILDNFEHLRDARADLATLLDRCPTAMALVTSREKLDLPGERVYTVQPLAVPRPRSLIQEADLLAYPATRLFLEYLRHFQSDLTLTPVMARTIAKICGDLDGIPLAIQLAAARAATMPLRVIAAQLASATRSSFLGWPHHERMPRPDRQRTLRDALAWSYRLLQARDQIVFRRLSVFVGGWTEAAAYAVVGMSAWTTDEVDASLASLVGKSLIWQEAEEEGTAYYQSHLIMRAYGAELLDQRKETGATRQRYVDYYATLVESLEQALTGATQATSLNQLTREYANIRTALYGAREQDMLIPGLRMASSLWWFWENRGYLTEGREWIEGFLARCREEPTGADDEMIGRAHYCAAIIAVSLGDRAQAERHALASLERVRDRAKRARVLLMLGNFAKFRGAAPDAQRYYSDGLTILREVGDMKGLLVALNNLSTLAIEHGDLAVANDLLAESLALKRVIGDRRGVGVSLMNLGEIRKLQGRYAEAMATTMEGLAIFSELDDLPGIQFACTNLAEIAEASGDLAHASELYAQGLAVARRMEDLPNTAKLLTQIGRLLATDDPALAAASLREAAAIFQAIDDVAGALACLFSLVDLADQHDAGLTVECQSY